METLKKLIALVLSVVLVPTLTWAQNGPVPSVTKFDTSFNVGPIAVSMQMTNPLQAQTGVVWNTLHIEARDDTQTPPLHVTLDAVGQAADPATLLGGFLPAAILVQREVGGGTPLAQAIADAQAKTGVTITSFHDGLTEYALILALVGIIAMCRNERGFASLKPPNVSNLVQDAD